MHLGASNDLITYARTLRDKPTEAEEKLWRYLSDSKLVGAKVRRQHPLLFFIADFYCHAAGLAIEVDGGVHEEGEQFQYDQGRTAELGERGIEVIRFSNEEVLLNIAGVVDTIKIRIHDRINELRPFRGGGNKERPIKGGEADAPLGVGGK